MNNVKKASKPGRNKIWNGLAERSRLRQYIHSCARVYTPVSIHLYTYTPIPLHTRNVIECSHSKHKGYRG